MTERRNVSSGAPWEPVVGYSRAVRTRMYVTRIEDWEEVGRATRLVAPEMLVEIEADAYVGED